MKVVIFGATGMIGQGVLLECLKARDVSEVVAIGRTPVTQTHPKLRQLVLNDLTALSAVRDTWAGAQAGFFCLGVSAAGMSEARYSQLTHDLTLSIASQLADSDPGMVFTYVTGAGADSSEQGTVMWARVKGKTENDLQKLPFKGVYLFRPGMILPLDGIVSKTALYRWSYRLIKPLLWIASVLVPARIVSTRGMGQVMLGVARQGAGRQVLEAADIARLARRVESAT